METWKRCKREETGKNRGSKGEGEGEERDREREGASPPPCVLVKRVNQLLFKSQFGLDFLPIVRESSSLDTSFRFEFLGFFCFCFFNDKGQYNFITGNMCTSVCKYN